MLDKKVHLCNSDVSQLLGDLKVQNFRTDKKLLGYYPTNRTDLKLTEVADTHVSYCN